MCVKVFDLLMDGSELLEKLQWNTSYFRSKMAAAGFSLKVDCTLFIALFCLSLSLSFLFLSVSLSFSSLYCVRGVFCDIITDSVCVCVCYLRSLVFISVVNIE